MTPGLRHNPEPLASRPAPPVGLESRGATRRLALNSDSASACRYGRPDSACFVAFDERQ
jgi:hypothetical protein